MRSAIKISRLSNGVCLLIGLFTWISAQAHEIRPAYMQITHVATSPMEYQILWKKPILQTGLSTIEPVFSTDCKMTDLAPPEASSGAITYHWRTSCNLRESPLKITGLDFSHTDVLVRLETQGGDIESYVLVADDPVLDLQQEGAPEIGYFKIGVEHLVFGIDHVLFVIGLYLFIHAPLALIKTITAFTVAHSITLALSVMQLVKLNQGPIEAVIALSILFLARELVQEEDKRSRLTLGRPWIMAFMFGLLHGLGFAGALADIGLPEDNLWISLLLFNIGIEAGQIAVILLLTALSWVSRSFQEQDRFNKGAGWAMGCFAAFWTIDRTILLF
jgi:hydrogenase/urease accessory protein HupE